MKTIPDLSAHLWRELAQNPVINHVREHDNARDAYGDPQVLLPGQYDEQWHIFFHGFTEDAGQWFHHMISPDGIHWSLKQKWQNEMGQSFVLKHEDKFIFYSSCYVGGENVSSSMVEIRAFTTKDFETFSDPVVIASPELDWEMEGVYKQVRNPCVIQLPDGRFRLYYCGGVVFLNDLGYEEPKYVSYAESDSPYGPFVKHGKPILLPDPSIAHRNLGSGALKVFGYEDGYIGLYNGIYQDQLGRSTSAISLLSSEDGIEWKEAEGNPIVYPTDGWKKAIVYQLDLVEWDGMLRMYFNARDEWRDGIEKIGMLAMPYQGTPIRKLSGY